MGLGLLGYQHDAHTNLQVLYQPFGIDTHDFQNFKNPEPPTDITLKLGNMRKEIIEILEAAPSEACEINSEVGRLIIKDGDKSTEIDGYGCVWSHERSGRLISSEFRRLRKILDGILPGSEQVIAAQLGRKATMFAEKNSSVLGTEFQAMNLAWNQFTRDRAGEVLTLDDVLIQVDSTEKSQHYMSREMLQIPTGHPLIVVRICPRLMRTIKDFNTLDGPEHRATFIYQRSDLKLLMARDDIPY